MGRLVQTGGTNPFLAFEMNAFGDQHANMYNFIQSQYDNMSTTMDEASRRFVETAREVSNRVNDSTAIRLAKAAINKISAIWQDGGIRQYNTYAEIQNANDVMRRYIMANPAIRAWFHQEACDGYSGKYEDVQPGRIGEDHYDYRRVMDGIVVFDQPDADGTVNWTSTNYLDEILDGDEELDISKQLDIIRTWSVFEDELRFGATDPTDVFNGKL